MTKVIAKVVYFGGMLIFVALFIRFAWIKEQTGEMFPVYITPIVMVILAIMLVGFYIAGCYIFDEEKK